MFILYLDKSQNLSKASEKLIEGLTNRLNYLEDDKSFFYRFLIWKNKVKITSEQYEKYMIWLHSEVDKRTDAVVGGGFREAYRKGVGFMS